MNQTESRMSSPLPEVGFVREPVVLAHVPMKRTLLRQMVATGAFPAPQQFGPRCVAYDVTKVRAWIAERAAAAPVVQFKAPKPRASASSAQSAQLAA